MTIPPGAHTVESVTFTFRELSGEDRWILDHVKLALLIDDRIVDGIWLRDIQERPDSRFIWECRYDLSRRPGRQIEAQLVYAGPPKTLRRGVTVDAAMVIDGTVCGEWRKTTP